MNSVLFQEHGDFAVVDVGLAELARGGIQATISLFGQSSVNNGCQQDITNSMCFSPNVGARAQNTACAGLEVI